MAVRPTAALFNHSCWPNTVRSSSRIRNPPIWLGFRRLFICFVASSSSFIYGALSFWYYLKTLLRISYCTLTCGNVTGFQVFHRLLSGCGFNIHNQTGYGNFHLAWNFAFYNRPSAKINNYWQTVYFIKRLFINHPITVANHHLSIKQVYLQRVQDKKKNLNQILKKKTFRRNRANIYSVIKLQEGEINRKH